MYGALLELLVPILPFSFIPPITKNNFLFIGHFYLLYYWLNKFILSKSWYILQELG